MFWKKKDKDEAPKGKDKGGDKGGKAEAAPPPGQRAPEPPRAPQSSPQSAPQPAPQAARSQPAPAPAAQPGPAGGGPGGAIEAVLNGRRAPKGAPLSPESVIAQAEGAASLAQSQDATDRAAAQAILAGDIERGFDALKDAAVAAGPAGVARWRMLGQIAFNVDAGRAMFAYEHVYNFHPRRFWDCIFVSRLRGLGGQMDGAREASENALAAAANDVERGMARTELSLIALANNDPPTAIAHAEEAVRLGKAAGTGPGGEWAMVGRIALLGDAALRIGAIEKARAAYGEALDRARRMGAQSPNDQMIARGICEMLEKVAAAASFAKDTPAATKALDEALGIRRKLAPAIGGAEGQRGVAQTLTLKGEILTAADDAAGAKAAFDEGVAILRQVTAGAPADPGLQRELWSVLWRMALLQKVGVGWRDVAQTMERMQGAGGLDPEGAKFLDEARRRAAA